MWLRCVGMAVIEVMTNLNYIFHWATILNHNIILRSGTGELMQEKRRDVKKPVKEKCKTCGICYPRRKRNE